ncbi:translation initiation factor IF-2-like [Choloepus didactylus]|uniref:translation initiation factor IF-2-like n=1 Tax=Choloepus didactylus TaxID=27675 RepID=UPI0018A04B17|nr:translation initiation factor IF-2-like [Choloepus didactylus]
MGWRLLFARNFLGFGDKRADSSSAELGWFSCVFLLITKLCVHWRPGPLGFLTLARPRPAPRPAHRNPAPPKPPPGPAAPLGPPASRPLPLAPTQRPLLRASRLQNNSAPPPAPRSAAAPGRRAGLGTAALGPSEPLGQRAQDEVGGRMRGGTEAPDLLAGPGRRPGVPPAPRRPGGGPVRGGASAGAGLPAGTGGLWGYSLRFSGPRCLAAGGAAEQVERAAGADRAPLLPPQPSDPGALAAAEGPGLRAGRGAWRGRGECRFPTRGRLGCRNECEAHGGLLWPAADLAPFPGSGVLSSREIWGCHRLSRGPGRGSWSCSRCGVFLLAPREAPGRAPPPLCCAMRPVAPPPRPAHGTLRLSDGRAETKAAKELTRRPRGPSRGARMGRGRRANATLRRGPTEPDLAGAGAGGALGLPPSLVRGPRPLPCRDSNLDAAPGLGVPCRARFAALDGGGLLPRLWSSPTAASALPGPRVRASRNQHRPPFPSWSGLLGGAGTRPDRGFLGL